MDDEESESSGCETPPREQNSARRPRPNSTKTKSQKNRKKFVESWLCDNLFKDWLSKVEDNIYLAKCKICGVTFACGRTELIRHKNRDKHKNKVQEIELAQQRHVQLPAFFSHADEVKKAEAMICALIAQLNLPLSSVDTILPVLKALPSKPVLSKMTLGKQKATNVVRQGLGAFCESDLVKTLSSTPFSLFLDESTDCGEIKQLAVMVMFVNDDLHYEVDFLGIVPCPDGTALGIFNTFVGILEIKKIPLSNWIRFCSDTTSSMMGQFNSVSQLIRQHYSWVIIVKCSCHLIHLAASYGCKKLPTSLEDLCRTVYNHFNRSFKNSESFKEYQEFSNVAVHKLLKPGQTRWLSLQDCTRRLIEQWPALKLYWTQLALEDSTHANSLTLETLRNPLMFCLAEFLEYSLDLFNEIHTNFQAEVPKFHDLKEEIQKLVKVLAQNFMKHDYVKKTSSKDINPLKKEHYLDIEKVYIGVSASNTLNELMTQTDQQRPNKDEVSKIFKAAQSFYIEAVLQVQKRFKFEDNIYTDIEIIYPQNASAMIPSSIQAIAKRHIKPSWNINLKKLDEEWRFQSLLDITETDVVAYWSSVFSTANVSSSKFADLKKVVKFFLTVPFSNAVVERLFSSMKNIKTEKRNALQNVSLAGLLHTKYGMKRRKETASSIKFDREMLQFLVKVKANATGAEAHTEN